MSVKSQPRFFPTRPALAGVLEAGILPFDRLFNRLYSWRFNPLYQSGTLAVLFLLTTVATGLYQLIFYKISSPYESVMYLESQWYLGQWVRAVHSYAGDAMIISVAVHAFRMFIQGRTWGPRILAWLSGMIMVGVLFFSAWTGMILVWDTQGEWIAVAGARIIDVVPLFSEPIERSFTGSDGVPSSFFFLNLLLHMVFPIGMLFLLWIHTLRLARPKYLPPRKLSIWMIVSLIFLGILWPLGRLPEADSLRIAGEVEVDVFYGWWLFFTRSLPPWGLLLMWVSLGTLGLSVPWWWRPHMETQPLKATNNEDLCTGCLQCYLDCPFEAIDMISPPPGNLSDTEKVAHVDPTMCVSCGICAGSCAPMLVGPPGRKGRDHLVAAQKFFEKHTPGAEDLVVMVCEQGLAKALDGQAGIVPFPVHCVGAMHTSALEYLLRKGVGGLYMLACPERDCTYREGAAWMAERIYNDREAELRDRVDKNRVRLAHFGRGEKSEALHSIRSFQAELKAGDTPQADSADDLERDCEEPAIAGETGI